MFLAKIGKNPFKEIHLTSFTVFLQKFIAIEHGSFSEVQPMFLILSDKGDILSGLPPNNCSISQRLFYCKILVITWNYCGTSFPNV